MTPATTDHSAVQLLTPASLIRRLVARAVDTVAVATWMFALSVAHIFIHLQLWSDSVAPEPWGNWFLATITFVVVYALYDIAFTTRTGATPGKDLLGLKVVDTDTGLPPSLSAALIRWLPFGVLQPVPPAWLAVVLSGLVGATGFAHTERRALHDRLSGTQVVRKELPDTEEGRLARRRAFTPRFVDPIAVYRMARSNPRGLRRHPSEHDT